MQHFDFLKWCYPFERYHEVWEQGEFPDIAQRSSAFLAYPFFANVCENRQIACSLSDKRTPLGYRLVLYSCSSHFCFASCFLMYGSVFCVCILEGMSVRIVPGAKAGWVVCLDLTWLPGHVLKKDLDLLCPLDSGVLWSHFLGLIKGTSGEC